MTLPLETIENFVAKVDELCVSLDRAAEDEGGSRSAGEIIREIGPMIAPTKQACADIRDRLGRMREIVKKLGE